MADAQDACRLVRISVDTLVDGLGGSPLLGAAILMKDGVIVQVGPERRVETPAGASNMRFGEGSTALPGLVDAHVHLTFDPSSSDVAGAEDVDVQVSAAQGRARTAGRAGVLTTFDCGATAELTTRLRDPKPEVGQPRILMSGPPVTPSGGHCHYLGGVIETTTSEAVRRRVQELAELGVDGVKLMATGGIMTTDSNPLDPALPGELVRTLTEEAHRHGLRVTAHAHSVAGMRVCVDNGIDSFEHASMIGPTGDWTFDVDLARDLVRREVRCVSTLTPGTDAGRERRLESLANRRLFEALAYETRVKNFSSLREQGVQVIAGTDVGTPATDFRHQLHDELVALVDAGFRPMDAICAATSGAARHLGIDREVGSLQPGRVADVVVVAGDPTENIRRIRTVEAVFAQGALLGRPEETPDGRAPS
jgi:imidazolonepropionase-like amidohydrolase